MSHKKIFRTVIVSVAGVLGSFSMLSMNASAQQIQSYPVAHFQATVFEGSSHAGWYAYPGQQPKLRFTGNDVRITSRQHSTVMLSQGGNTSDSAVEVWLIHAPISTSSISGLGVMGDADHAMVIGLEDGNVVLWQLDPQTTRIVARQPVNATSPLEFRVSGGDAAQVRFFWRHRGDKEWHPLGNAASNQVLATWHEALHYGLLLDGPQGSQVTFSNYHSVNQGPAMTAMLIDPR